MTTLVERTIIGQHDAEGIFVYQAFRPEIVEDAIRLGTFGKGFNFDRMTWIKPSFGWMLYRSGYATKHRQERILKIKLAHDVFLALLRRAVATSFNRRVFASEAEWQQALRRTDVRYQWDPDRNWKLGKMERRAIQIGLEGEAVQFYVRSILLLTDVTALAHECRDATQRRKGRPAAYPDETEYPVPADVGRLLGVSASPDPHGRRNPHGLHDLPGEISPLSLPRPANSAYDTTSATAGANPGC